MRSKTFLAFLKVTFFHKKKKNFFDLGDNFVYNSIQRHTRIAHLVQILIKKNYFDNLFRISSVL